MRPIPVGLVLQPDRDYLARIDPLLEAVDYVEIAPETTWHLDTAGRLTPNGYWRLFATFVAERGIPAVAHGVGLSMGSTVDRVRRRAWLGRLVEDQRVFRYHWYTDHLGATVLAGEAFTLPLPVPMDGPSARRIRASLAAMRCVCPEVGFENTAFPFVLGDPMEEPAFIRRCLGSEGRLLLDLHNLHTMAVNLRFDAGAYLDRLPLERVIEVHISGGVMSEPGWLPEGRRVRLDSHDNDVPEPVWSLLEAAIPRCPAVRGITLERMEGTLTDENQPRFIDEIGRLSELVS